MAQKLIKLLEIQYFEQCMFVHSYSTQKSMSVNVASTWPQVRPKLAPRSPNMAPTHASLSTTTIQKAPMSVNMASTWPRVGPKLAPKWPKMAPTCHKHGSRLPQDGQRWLQDCLVWLIIGLMTAQDAPSRRSIRYWKSCFLRHGGGERGSGFRLRGDVGNPQHLLVRGTCCKSAAFSADSRKCCNSHTCNMT